MGKVAPSAPPLVQATVAKQQNSPSTLYQNMNNVSAPKPNNTRISALSNNNAGNNNNSGNNNAADQSLAAELVESAASGQTFYIRAVERTFLHRYCLFVNFLVIVAAFGLAIGQVWGIAIKNMNMMETVMRAYLIAISGMIILNECEVASLLQNSPILYKYPWRGLFYTFMGALGTLLNDLGNDDYTNNWNRNRYNYQNGTYNNGSSNTGYVTFQIPSLEHGVEMFLGATSRLLFAMGVVYFLMGMCFMQKKAERDIEAYRHRLRLTEKNFGGHQDVVRRRVGGRIGEELGIAVV